MFEIKSKSSKNNFSTFYPEISMIIEHWQEFDNAIVRRKLACACQGKYTVDGWITRFATVMDEPVQTVMSKRSIPTVVFDKTGHCFTFTV